MSSLTKKSLAIDLGTSNLAGRLFSRNGNLLAERSLPNLQQKLGADILSRLQVAREEGSSALQVLLIKGLRELVGQLLKTAQASCDEIGSVALAGNPGMACLLLGHPAESLLFPPHRPTYKTLLSIPVDKIGLGLPVPLKLFPPVSGYVGGDLLAYLLGLGEPRPATLLVDVGSNAEIALWDGNRWWVTSAAAGAAF